MLVTRFGACASIARSRANTAQDIGEPFPGNLIRFRFVFSTLTIDDRGVRRRESAETIALLQTLVFLRTIFINPHDAKDGIL